MQKRESVESYIKTLPADVQKLFNDLRKRIKSFVPDAVEDISYNMPAFRYKGKQIAGYDAFKNHWSYFPMSGALIQKFGDELKDFETSKGTILIPYGKTLPDGLLKKLIKTRLKEIEDRK